MRMGVIGCGFVGASCAKAMMLRGSVEHIVLHDIDSAKAQGLANDLSHGSLLCPPVKIEAGEIDALANSDILVITAGINERTGKAIDRDDPRGRLLLLPDNTRIFKELLPKLYAVAPDAIFLIVTDPPDALADVARIIIPGANIISTGTYLDSLRFRFQIANHLDCKPSLVDAMVLGEHGTSQVYVWSTAIMDGESILDLIQKRGHDKSKFCTSVEEAVKFANIQIIEGIGASQHGIGIVTARIVEAIVQNEGLIIPVGIYHEKYKVTLSLPSKVDATGVSETITINLSEDEEKGLRKSATVLKEALATITI